MGGFYGSISARTEDRPAVVAALDGIAKATTSRFLVTPPREGWVCIYPDSSGQDERISRRIARRLDCDLIHLISHDEDVFLYFVYRGGRLLDRYNSDPGYSEEVSASARRRWRGRPALFADLFAGRATVQEVEGLLAQSGASIWSSEQMVRFASMLGLPHDVQTSYEYLREDEEDVEGWDRYIHVPDLSRENARRRREAEEVEARKRRHREAGELLVERVNERPRGAMGYPVACPDAGGGFLACPDAGYGPGPAPLLRYGPPWSAGPIETGIVFDEADPVLVPSPSGRYLAIGHGSGSGWRVDLQDETTIRPEPLVAAPNHLSWFDFTPDESRWVGATKDRILIGSLDGGREPIAWPLPGVRHGVIHPGGEVAVFASEGNRLTLVEFATGRVLKSLLFGGLSQQAGLPAMIQFHGPLAEKIAGVMAAFDLAALEGRRQRRQDEFRQRLQQEGFRPDLIAGPPPDEATIEIRKRIEAAWVETQQPFRDELRRLVREQSPPEPRGDIAPEVRIAETPGPIPEAVPRPKYEELYQGAEAPIRLLSDPEGRWLFCGTDCGVRVFGWLDLGAAIGMTPPPAFAVEPEPYREETDHGVFDGPVNVYDLAFDVTRRRLLFVTMGGQVGFVDLDDGGSGILLDVPGRPPLMSLHLASDRSAICITCHPDRLGRRRHRKRASLQIWDYRALTSRLERSAPRSETTPEG